MIDAVEFRADSLRIKSSRNTEVTMESLEATRVAYLESHPGAAIDLYISPSLSQNPTPTREQVERGDYILKSQRSEV